MQKFYKNMVILFAFAMQLSFQSVWARELSFSGQVIAVTDGDTIKVLHDGYPEKIRLSGVDCPEKKQAFGARAKSFTSDLCFGKLVMIVPKSHDRYGRTVAQVVLPDGRVLNTELIRSGFAWWYKKYAADDRQLAELEVTARNHHIGLWSELNPKAPWEFRSERKSAQGLPHDPKLELSF